MTDMTAVSDTSPARTSSPIEPVRTMSARDLSRNMAATLRCVADEGHSFAITHFGRVIGFLVPLDGRMPVRRGGKVVYEVAEPEPLLELTASQLDVLRILHRRGESVPDLLIPPEGTWAETAMTLFELETTKPRLIVKSWMGYKLTAAGERHAQELGL